MAVLLFKLTNVPDDEADEVRQLLKDGGFNVYETGAGRWKVGVPAIWLADHSQLDDAQAQLLHYQTQRAQRMRQHYEALKASGQAPTLWSHLASKPTVVLSCILGAGILIAVMILPFLGFLQ